MRGPDRKIIRIARKLRVNQTDAETVLWNRIRNRQIDGHKFVRQVPIGGEILDFVFRGKRLFVEEDGGAPKETACEPVVCGRFLQYGTGQRRVWAQGHSDSDQGELTPFTQFLQLLDDVLVAGRDGGVLQGGELAKAGVGGGRRAALVFAGQHTARQREERHQAEFVFLRRRQQILFDA